MDQRQAFIISLVNRLNAHNGVPESPIPLAYRMVDLGRRMGRTTELVKALPDDGKAVVLVWNRDNADHIRTMCRDIRGGDYPVKNIKFLTYDDWRSHRYEPDYLWLPAFIDNHVYDMLAVDLAEVFNDEFNPPKEKVQCEQSTPSTVSSEKSSKRSRKSSKKSATIGD